MSWASTLTLGVITVDSAGRYSFNWKLFLYYAVDLSILISVASFLTSREQVIAAVLTTILLCFVFYFYYIRFFNVKNNTSNPAVPDPCAPSDPVPVCDGWPPIVNMCPDFMVAWKDPSSGHVYCYDDKNTFNMKNYNGAGLQEITINGVKQRAYLQTDLVKIIKDGASVLKGDSLGKYLTWEGVWQAEPSKASANSAVNAPNPSDASS
jgi:hypothetical protein